MYFFDRDGTLNVHKGYITNPDDIELLPNVADALKIINKKGILSIVITNQPVVARGDINIKTLNLVNNKLTSLLGKAGAYIDDLYYCPHHPDKGFPNEIKALKKSCECRKPGVELLEMRYWITI